MSIYRRRREKSNRLEEGQEACGKYKFCYTKKHEACEEGINYVYKNKSMKKEGRRRITVLLADLCWERLLLSVSFQPLIEFLPYSDFSYSRTLST